MHETAKVLAILEPDDSLFVARVLLGHHALQPTEKSGGVQITGPLPTTMLQYCMNERRALHEQVAFFHIIRLETVSKSGERHTMM
ncbi:hypothetical protein D3C84_1239890 [compost metagenome]